MKSVREKGKVGLDEVKEISWLALVGRDGNKVQFNILSSFSKGSRAPANNSNQAKDMNLSLPTRAWHVDDSAIIISSSKYIGVDLKRCLTFPAASMNMLIHVFDPESL